MPHYYSEKQDSPAEYRKIMIRLKSISFEMFSGSGVFSKKKLDRGSELLIESAIVHGKVLDIGCGTGAVGISLKLLNPDIDLTMSDVNERAIALAKKNSRLNSIEAKVIKSDLFEKLERYDCILSNPPQSAGKEICFKLIEDAHDHLNPGGILEVVARHNKGGAVLSNKMEEVFGNSEEISKESGFRVYVSRVQ